MHTTLEIDIDVHGNMCTYILWDMEYETILLHLSAHTYTLLPQMNIFYQV